MHVRVDVCEREACTLTRYRFANEQRALIARRNEGEVAGGYFETRETEREFHPEVMRRRNAAVLNTLIRSLGVLWNAGDPLYIRA